MSLLFSSSVCKFASKSIAKETATDFDANVQTELENNKDISRNPRKKRDWGKGYGVLAG